MTDQRVSLLDPFLAGPSQSQTQPCTPRDDTMHSLQFPSDGSTTSVPQIPGFPYALHKSRIMHGVPTMTLRPSTVENTPTPRFTGVYAFSRDGLHLSAASSKNTFSVWRTLDSSLMAQISIMDPKKREEDNLFLDMAFLDGSNNKFVTAMNSVETNANTGCLNLLKFELTQTASSEEKLKWTLKICWTTQLPGHTGLNDQAVTVVYFSEDGRTMVYMANFRDPKELVRVMRLEEDDKVLLVHECRLNGFSRQLPLLSKNGESLALLCAVDGEFNSSNLKEDNFAVYISSKLSNPTLKFKRVDGDRCMWGCDGQYCLIWDSTNPSLLLKLYETERLQTENMMPQPIGSIFLDYGLYYAQAQVMKNTDGANSSEIKVFIYALARPGGGRLLLWNVNSSQIEKEIEVNIVSRLPNSRNAASLQASDSIENRWPPYVFAEYVTLTYSDQQLHFSVSKDQKWAVVFSTEHGRGVLLSLVSETTVWRFDSGPETTENQLHWADVMFDKSGESVVLFRDDAVYFFAPICLRTHYTQRGFCECDLSNCLGPDDEENAFLLRLLQVLPRRATFHGFRRTRINNKHSETPFEQDDPLQFVSEHAYVIAPAISPNGEWLICLIQEHIDEDPRLATLHFRSRKGCIKRKHLNPLRNESENAVQWPMHTFIFPRDTENGSESVVWFFHSFGASMVIFYESPDQHENGKMSRFADDECILLTQTTNRRSIVVLHADRVSIYDLQQQCLVDTIPYKVNLRDAIALGTKGEQPRKKIAEQQGRRVSDNGQTILLLWDARNDKSICLNPETEKKAFEEIQQTCPKDMLSSLCALSPDGEITMYMERDVYYSHCFVFGLYSNTDHEVAYKFSFEHSLGEIEIDDAMLAKENQFVFFATTENNTELAVFVWTQSLVPYLCFSTAYDALGSIIPYPIFSSLKDNKEQVERTVDLCGPSLFSSPSFNGSSIFQEALLQNDSKTLELADKMSPVDEAIASPWTKIATEEADDVLIRVLDKHVLEDTKLVLQVICSGRMPFNIASALIKKHFLILIRQQMSVMQEAFLDDMFVLEACRMEMKGDILSEQNRMYTGAYIGTADSFLKWKVQSNDLRRVGKTWHASDDGDRTKIKKETEDSTQTVSLKFICIANAVGCGMNGIIRPLLLANAPASVFDSTAVKWVILHKWFNVWKPSFIVDAVFYAIFLILFSTYAIEVASTEDLSPDEREGIFPLILLFLVVICGVMFTFNEITQLKTFIRDASCYLGNWRSGVRYYFKSWWNLIDVFSCTAMTVVIPILHMAAASGIEAANYPLSLTIAIESLLAFVKVWNFAQPFHDAGALVLLVYRVIADTFFFLILAFMILLGFGVSMHVLFKNAEEEQIRSADDSDTAKHANEDVGGSNNFDTLPKSLETLFYSLLGNFDPEIFHAGGQSSWILVIFMIGYVASETIVLLNLLIAIMGDTFDRVKRTEQAQLLLSRASFIDAHEATRSDRELTRVERDQGKYLRALVGVNEESQEISPDVWKGRLEMMKYDMRANRKEMEKWIEKWLKEMREEIEDVKTQISATEIRNQKAMQEVKSQLETIVSLLQP